MRKHNLGLQLFTLREQCANDFPGTLRQVAELGYHGVEFNDFYGYPAKEVKKWVDDLNLQVIASLVMLDKMNENLDEVIQYHIDLGCNYIINPWGVNGDNFSDESRLDALIASMLRVSAACKARGIRYGYHNHAYEIENKIGGCPGLEVMYRKTTADELLAEPDVYWLRKGGLDEVAYLKSMSGRMPTIHLKDMAEDGFFSEIGGGILDMEAIFSAGDQAGVQWYVVEQDRCRIGSPLENVKRSIDYLKSGNLI